MLTSAEFLVLDFIQKYLKSDFTDWLMVRITSLGNGGGIWILICIFALMSKKYRKMGILLSVGLFAGYIFGNLILKPLLARPRPSWINDGIIVLIQNPRDFSFPSGHTLSSVTSAFIITYFDKKAGYFVIPLAALIAFSRLYLYVHFPTDVIGGIILGILIGYAVTKWGKRILKISDTK